MELGDALRAGKVSPVELTERCLRNIERFNPVVNAFITVTAESARTQARQAEDEIRRGNWRGPLHGVPFSLKDLIDVEGLATTAASRVCAGRVAEKTARVVLRLEEAGAILLGKNNLHEMAYGGSSMISAYGPVRNPWDPERIAGGSSGGSAAAVALEMACAAIGTDTAGSVREPAALCSLVGLKPTFGRVSTDGVLPLSGSLDHVGPIVSTVTDAAIVLSAIAEHPTPRSQRYAIDPNFPSAVRVNTSAMRVGLPRKFFTDELDPEVSAAFAEAVEVIRRLVAAVIELSLEPDMDRTLQSVEAYEIHRESIRCRPDVYDPETLRRLKTGEDVTLEARQTAELALENAREEIQRVFEEVDVLVTPTTALPAPRIDDLAAHIDQLRPTELRLLRNTRPFNVWAVPAVSLPCGFTREGLPIGLQIAGALWREDLVLRLAYAFEQATDWHKRKPKLLSSA
jgi:Asp-tRNA(Asn)/Glu-tRNA(Gln) amidotransferase A subunit family amidase